VILGLPLLLVGVGALQATADDPSVRGVYLAFLAALAIWGWIELTFLSGIITGPNTRTCPPGLPLGKRFLRATGTVLWHELLLAAGLALTAFLTLGQANAFGFWTFLVLFLARISAKLNLFFGVPRIHTEFLPKPLAHLASHFRHAPMNALFPASVLALALAAFAWIGQAQTAASDGAFVGHVLLAALTLLALAEHGLMVIPLPDQKLWRWMLPGARPALPEPPAE
jgi:putative photosynthetic complex assembly protein 2